LKNKSKEYLNEDKTFKFLDRNLWIRLSRLMKGHLLMVIVGFAFLIGAELLPQFQPKIVKAIIDGPIMGVTSSSFSLGQYCLAFLTIVILTGAFKYIAVICNQSVALNIIHKLRLELFAKVQSYQMDFFKRTPVGRLMTRLTNDIDALNSMFAEGFVDLAGALLMLIFPVFFMLQENWKLALITLLSAPFMMLLTSIFRVKVREINKVIRRLLAELNTNMQENLSGNHIVQIFGKSLEKWKYFDEKNKELKNSWLKNVKYYSYYFPLIHGLTEVSIMLLYFTGGFLLLEGQISIGTLLEFSLYMGMFWRPLREISDKYTQLQTALAASERVFTLFDIEATAPTGSLAKIEGPVQFQFKDVSFSYEEEQTVLKNVSFQVHAGQTCAVVGSTGSGKSTLLSLCNGFYSPDNGQISLNQVVLSNYDPHFYHRLVAFIPQDVYLFAETIAFNIALSPEVDTDRMKEVSRYVNAHPFIEKLEKGYDTLLTVRGENLSTGQRQLLAFARALYHQPQILLLDEATSSVDTETEALIQDALSKLTKKMTTLVVAHRLSTIRSADQILVMHKGEIRERGTHSELLVQKGIYHKLYQMQNLV